KLGVDPQDMLDRCALEVEDGCVLDEVRDLQDGAGAAVVDQERRITLAAEIDCGSLNAEDLGGNARYLVGGKAGRLGLEDATGHFGLNRSIRPLGSCRVRTGAADRRRRPRVDRRPARRAGEGEGAAGLV